MDDEYLVSDDVVVLADSVTDLRPGTAAGAVVACGSHGGVFAGQLAAHLRVGGIVFNDAGVGRDDAGIAGLAVLDACGLPACAVAHDCAEIGHARATLNAQVQHVNTAAKRIGCRRGQPVRTALGLMHVARPKAEAGQVDRPLQTRKLVRSAGVRIWALDSASLALPTDAGSIVVTGSHGGLPGGRHTRALKIDPLAAIFNDAAGGLNGAGWTRLEPLDHKGIPAGTVSASSARIGDGMSSLNDGVISHVNDSAVRLGLSTGISARTFVDRVVQSIIGG